MMNIQIFTYFVFLLILALRKILRRRYKYEFFSLKLHAPQKDIGVSLIWKCLFAR